MLYLLFFWGSTYQSNQSSNVTDNFTWAERSWIFIGMVGGLLLLKIIVEHNSPDISRDVEIQLERQAFITSKLIDGVPDELEVSMDVKRSNRYVIRIVDDDPN